jgi:polyferredoxin
MDKLGREQGLIAYSTLKDYNFNMEIATAGSTVPIDPARVRTPEGRFLDQVRHFDWRVIFRPRIILYTALWSLIGVGLLFALAVRERLQLDLLHDRNPQYVLESNGAIRNGYTLKILNMRAEPRLVMLSMSGLPGGSITVANDPLPKGRSLAVQVAPDTVHQMKIFITVAKDQLPASPQEFTMRIDYALTGEFSDYTATFNVPEQRK